MAKSLRSFENRLDQITELEKPFVPDVLIQCQKSPYKKQPIEYQKVSQSETFAFMSIY